MQEKTELNLIEEIFANRIKYLATENNYELRTINLMNRERSYDPDLKEWK